MSKLVQLLVNTAYKGPRKEGDVFPVPDDFASRWVKNGIAIYAEEKPNEDKTPDEPRTPDTLDEEPKVEKPDYSSMSAKDLYALCKERGIEVEAKQSKEYYIGKIQDSEKAE